MYVYTLLYTHIHLKHIVTVLASVVNMTCTRVTQEEGASVEKPLPLDWPVGIED